MSNSIFLPSEILNALVGHKVEFAQIPCLFLYN